MVEHVDPDERRAGVRHHHVLRADARHRREDRRWWRQTPRVCWSASPRARWPFGSSTASASTGSSSTRRGAGRRASANVSTQPAVLFVASDEARVAAFSLFKKWGRQGNGEVVRLSRTDAATYPLIPAKAGIQFFLRTCPWLGRGDEREEGWFSPKRMSHRAGSIEYQADCAHRRGWRTEHVARFDHGPLGEESRRMMPDTCGRTSDVSNAVGASGSSRRTAPTRCAAHVTRFGRRLTLLPFLFPFSPLAEQPPSASTRATGRGGQKSSGSLREPLRTAKRFAKRGRLLHWRPGGQRSSSISSHRGRATTIGFLVSLTARLRRPR